MHFRIMHKQIYYTLFLGIFLILILLSNSGCSETDELTFRAPEDIPISTLTVPDVDSTLLAVVMPENLSRCPGELLGVSNDFSADSLALWCQPSEDKLVVGGRLSFSDTAEASILLDQISEDSDVWVYQKENEIFFITDSENQSAFLRSAIENNCFCTYDNQIALHEVAMLPNTDIARLIATGIVIPDKMLTDLTSNYTDQQYSNILTNLLSLTQIEIVSVGLYASNPLNIADLVDQTQNQSIWDTDAIIVLIFKSDMPDIIAGPIVRTFLHNSEFTEITNGDLLLYKTTVNISDSISIPFLVRVDGNRIYVAGSGQESFAKAVLESTMISEPDQIETESIPVSTMETENQALIFTPAIISETINEDTTVIEETINEETIVIEEVEDIDKTESLTVDYVEPKSVEKFPVRSTRSLNDSSSATYYTETIPFPNEVSTDPVVIGTNLLLSTLMVIVFYFSATLFNKTFKENYQAFLVWNQRLIRFLPWKKHSEHINTPQKQGLLRLTGEILIIVLLTSIINCALIPTIGFNQGSLIIFVAMLAAVVVSTLSYNGIRALATRYIFKIPAGLKAYPLAIGLAILFVLVSRLIEFKPGFIFGFVGALAIYPGAPQPNIRQKATITLIGILSVIICAVIAFYLRGLQIESQNSFIALLIATILTAMCIGGLEKILFRLIPFTFLEGSSIYSWKKIIWLISFGIVIFLFVHVVVNNTNSLPDVMKNHDVIKVISITMIGLITAMVTWLFFKIKIRK